MSDEKKSGKFSMIRAAVHKALRSWHVVGQPHEEEEMLTTFFIVRQHMSSYPTEYRAAINEILLSSLEELAKKDSKSASIIKARFIGKESIRKLANQIHTSESTVSRLQDKGISALIHIIQDQENKLRMLKSQRIESQLPPASYAELFGVDEAVPILKSHLLDENGPPVISIEGMGGIGKTSLADAVTRSIISDFYFDQVVWLRTDPQTMSGWTTNPQLSFQSIIQELSVHLGAGKNQQSHIEQLIYVRQTLKQKRCLVVIDNLETQEDMAYLMDEINNLARPSKFLLTSRTKSLNQASIFSFSVQALNRGDSIALLRQQVKNLNVATAESITQDDFNHIFDAVGGNPLALKLVAGLLDFLSLDQILKNLVNVRSSAIESMYIRIYWQAWQVLTKQARKLLQSMPLVSEDGEESDFLQAIAELTEDEFWPALQELRNRSLIEIRGSIREKKYGIHRLTRTFLYTEIINWSDPRTKNDTGN